AAACAWLLAPAGFAQRLPGDDALGTPALGTYKAARDYDIPDEEATRGDRAAAMAAEPPVFDLDEGAADEVAARVREAFALAREARPPLDPTAFVARLGGRVAPADLAVLAEARFATALEEDLVALVVRGLTGKVVDDRRTLERAAERGLVARAVRGGAPGGERLDRDLALARSVDEARADVERAAAALPLPPAQRGALGRIAAGLVRPTLVFALAETAARQRLAAERVKPVVLHVRRGEKIVGDGEVIAPRHLLVFRAIRAQTSAAEVVLARLGAALLVALTLALLWRYGRQNVSGFHPARKDAVLLVAAALATAGLAAAGLAVGDVLHDRFPRLAPETVFHLVPFAAGAMVVRSVLPAEVALLFAVASGAIAGLMAGNSLFLALHATLTSVTAAGLVSRTRDRAGLVKVGLAVGVLGALLVVSAHLYTGRGLSEALAPALAAALAGAVLLPVVAVGILPMVEWAFGYLTDVKLLELANLNHPALKDLIVQAPGTYHHSVVVGALVEAAADAVGANPRLAKVCAYYHDVGKTRNPLYFAENQRGENRHDALAPSMSALIVKRHVTDGLELARQWRLPQAVADVIVQHHGTRAVSFFWAAARQRAAEAGDAGGGAGALDPALFHYPGPKPRSREAALVMIADSCEASARAMPEPSRERLRTLVARRIQEIVEEGQLDECELTLRDLRAVAEAMVRGLEAVYQGRPDYGRGEGAPPDEDADETTGRLQLVTGPERRRT
ncbi:MAG TPA: HDIG domain-containing protein, partial [Anaeromyxobacteraceae bacterium]|nr:HDIG domain-containing protein [Anaeromyxobacteraceae bacterium]